MHRVVLLAAVLVLAFGVTALVPAAPLDCADHPGKGWSGPHLCRLCPPPEPNCQLVACDRCGCRYWCFGPATAATTTVRRALARR